MSNYDALASDEERKAAFNLAVFLVKTPESPLYGESFSRICEGIAGNPEMLIWAMEMKDPQKSVVEAFAQHMADKFFADTKNIPGLIHASAFQWGKKIEGERAQAEEAIAPENPKRGR